MLESILWQYIQEEKDVLIQALKDQSVKEIAKNMKNVWDIIIVAQASCYNAAMAIVPIFEKFAGVHVYCLTPSQLLLRNEIDYQGCCIGISQTGQDQDVIDAISFLKGKGFMTLGITDNEDSSFSELCDDTLYLHCGKEESYAKIKGYSTTCFVLMRLALELALRNGKMSEKEYYEAYEDCREEIYELEEVISRTTRYFQQHEFGKYAYSFYFIGDGIHLATAMEGQLKIMETLCMPACFSSSMELGNGMHRTIKDTSTLVFIDDGQRSALVKKSVDYFRQIGAQVLHISNQNPSDIRISNYGFTHSLFSFSVIIQILAVFVAEINELNPNCVSNDTYRAAL